MPLPPHHKRKAELINILNRRGQMLYSNKPERREAAMADIEAATAELRTLLDGEAKG